MVLSVSVSIVKRMVVCGPLRCCKKLSTLSRLKIVTEDSEGILVTMSRDTCTMARDTVEVTGTEFQIQKMAAGWAAICCFFAAFARFVALYFNFLRTKVHILL